MAPRAYIPYRRLVPYVPFTLQPEAVESVRHEASAVAGHCGRSECREQVSPEVAWLPLGADDVRVAHESEHIGAEVRVLVQAGVRQVVELRRQQRLQWQWKAGALGRQLSTPPCLPTPPPFVPLLFPLAYSLTTYYLHFRVLGRQRAVDDALHHLEVVTEGWVREGAARTWCA